MIRNRYRQLGKTMLSGNPALARLFIATACTLAATIVPTGAAAADDRAVSGTLEEVIVSARYRDESVQTTPLAITVIAADSLTERNITNVENLGAAVPNTFITTGAAGSAGAPTISMRGVTQSDFIFAFEPGVGVYIDDVYRPNLLGSDMDLMDIDHIEVLRGPQGTLFGKNSMGGAIRLFSKKPQGDDTGYFEATAGNQGRLDFRGSFDTALIPDKLFMRVSAASRHIDGYVRLVDFACQMNNNGTPGLIPAGVTTKAFAGNNDCEVGNEGEENPKAGRVMLRYVATDKLELSLALDKTNDDKTVTPDITIGAISRANAIVSGFIPPTGVWDNRFLAPNRYTSYAAPNSPNVNFMHEWGIAGTGSYDFTDHVRAKVIIGHRIYDSGSSFNADASPLGLIQNWNPVHHTQDSYELQVSGEAFNNALEWTTGAYSFDGKTHLGGHIIYTTLSFDQDDDFLDKNQSVFAHAVYNATDKLSFTGGLRYSKNEKTFNYHHVGLGSPIPVSAKFEDKRPDWTVGANYKLTPDTMAYTTVSTGYRPGGINPRPIITPDQLVPFDGEEMTSYELGLKTQMLDNRLRANLAGFYSDYSSHLSQGTLNECLGLPGTVGIPGPPPTPFLPGTCPTPPTFAAVPWFAYFTDKATVKGVEAELTFEPVPELLMNGSVGWNKFESKFKNKAAPSYRDPVNLPQPEFNISAGVQYGMKVPGGKLTPRLDWLYQSKMTYSGVLALPYDPRFGLTGQAAYDLTATPSRSLFNARIGFESEDAKWNAALSVTNLFDKFYWQNKFDLSGLVVSGIPSRPREWAITVQRNFR